MITYECALQRVKEYLKDSDVALQLTHEGGVLRGGFFAINLKGIWRQGACRLNWLETDHS